MLGLPDQESAFHLSAICRSLGDLFRAERPEIVITHAYEGGHPDHDAVALAVHNACSLLGQEGDAPALIDIPLYRAAGREWVRQCFESRPGSTALSLKLSDTEAVLKRLSSRRVCVNCETNYSMNNPPTVDWKCDICGDRVIQREDDTEAAIKRRLELYEEQTAPLIAWYMRKDKLVAIDAVGTPDEVTFRLTRAIDLRLRSA